jgi:hypothetical protein
MGSRGKVQNAGLTLSWCCGGRCQQQAASAMRPDSHRSTVCSLWVLPGGGPHDLFNFHSTHTYLLYLSLVSKLIISEADIFLFNGFLIYLKGPAASAGSLGLLTR